MEDVIVKVDQEKYVKTQWVAVLPAAIAASFVGPILVFIFEWLFATQSRIDQWWALILQSIVMGAAFVWAGSAVAPAHNGRVALVLAAVAIFVLGGFGVLFLETKEWWNLCHILITACAAAITGYAMHKELG